MSSHIVSVMLWDVGCSRCGWVPDASPFARLQDAEAEAWAHDLAGCLTEDVRLEGFEPPAP